MATYDSGLNSLHSIWDPPPADRDPAANNFQAWRQYPQCAGKSDEEVARVAHCCYTNPQGLSIKQQQLCRQTCAIPEGAMCAGLGHGGGSGNGSGNGSTNDKETCKPCTSTNGGGSRCIIL